MVVQFCQTDCLHLTAEQAKPRLSTKHRTVCGVCVDVQNTHRLASFGEVSTELLWLRGFDDLAVSDVHGEFEVVIKDSQIILFNSVIIKQEPSN